MLLTTSLLWTDLEPWMDAEYMRQVCALMRWEAGVFVNQGANGGYCVLTFASPAAAAAALMQVRVSFQSLFHVSVFSTS
jgi:hypothetical protein